MKKTQVILILAVFATGILLAGCQQPATEVPESHTTANGTVTITPAGSEEEVTGSVTMELPTTLETSGSVSITEAEGAATEAMEEAKDAVQ